MKNIVTITILFIFTVTGCNNADPEKIIINEDYRGNVIIIHNQPEAVNIEKNGRKILRIPQNGILKVQSPINEGWQDQVVYIEDKNGNMSKVPIYAFTGLSTQIEEGKVDTSKVALYGGSVGTSTYYEDGLECEIDWTHYIFGTYREVLNTNGRGEIELKDVLIEKGVKVTCQNKKQWPIE
ncbi:MAG: hypothetical protein WDZ35_00890 [Crocinitomicaceae bacterium]